MENNKSIINQKMYTLKELEQILGTTRVTLLNYVHSGKLKCVKICGKWKLSEENLERYLKGEEQV